MSYELPICVGICADRSTYSEQSYLQGSDSHDEEPWVAIPSCCEVRPNCFMVPGAYEPPRACAWV
jgi:hypothetical protein